MENLYDILEVSRKASKEVIDKAYKTLAKKYHPDRFIDESQKAKADLIFQQITQYKRDYNKLLELEKIAEQELHI